MTTSTERWSGRIALMVAHCACMVDLVALPVWVGTLVEQYQLDPQRAGALATLFLVGAVASSLFFAPRLRRMSGRVASALGFALAAAAFFGVSFISAYAAMAVLHVVAGVGAACALSFTHGTIACSARPHRLFALVSAALGLFAVAFFGAMPKLVVALGGPVLFLVLGGVMGVAAAVCAGLFPNCPWPRTVAAPHRPTPVGGSMRRCCSGHWA